MPFPCCSQPAANMRLIAIPCLSVFDMCAVDGVSSNQPGRQVGAHEGEDQQKKQQWLPDIMQKR